MEIHPPPGMLAGSRRIRTLPCGGSMYGPPYCKSRLYFTSPSLTLENRYPTSYFVLALPLSVVRWICFSDEKAHASDPTFLCRPVATITVISIFGLSGLVNALLYSFTRTRFLRPDKRATREPKAPVIRMNPRAEVASNNSTAADSMENNFVGS
jgi:hypothetical protein